MRAYPGDRYPVTGYIQAQGLAGKTVTVQLLSRDMDPAGDRSRRGTGQVEASQQVILGGDGEITPVPFELTPNKTRGPADPLLPRHTRPKAIRDPADKYREADIEIVDRKNRVLLLAGGPTREYQFLRTLLYRDRSTTVDVLLQTAQAGVSQEAAKILSEFPATREAMSAYDCVVAFDPNWQALTPVEIDVLHDWVDSQGGGLIVVGRAGVRRQGDRAAGCKTRRWPRSATCIPSSSCGSSAPRRTSLIRPKSPGRLDFTREGPAGRFPLAGRGPDRQPARRGRSFAGVYSFFPVRGPKPGAAVLATFSDPAPPSRRASSRPISSSSSTVRGGCSTWAAARCGGSAALDPADFDQFYTKLIRHVSQGRLLRGSSRGVLLVGQDRYLLGNTVEVAGATDQRAA